MADNLIRITDAMLEGKGVIPLEDIPGLSADAMKAKIEEIIRTVVIPTFNDNMNEIANYIYYDPGTGAAYITVDSLVQTYARIQSATDTDGDKTASIIALKEMDTALKQSMSTTSGKVTTLEGKMNTVEGKVATLETQGWIVFDKNDGTDLPDKKSVKCTFNYTNNTVKIPTTVPTFTRTGYTFLGWAEARSAETAEYQAGDTISNLDQHSYGNMVCLNAVWQENTP
jgi:hypothetical protein